MAVATVVSRVSALAARLLLAAALGFGLVNDSYNVANTLPNQVYELLLGGVLSSVAIPVLVRAQRSDDDGGQAYAQRLLTVGVIALAAGTVVAVAAAPWLIRLSVGDGPGTDPALATTLAYLLLPQIFFYGLAALLGAILNSRGVFGPAAWAPVANNGVLIAVLGAYLAVPGEITLNPVRLSEPKLWVLGAGTTVGIVVQALVLLPALRRVGFAWRWKFSWDPRLTTFGGLAGWSVIYAVLGQVGLTITFRLAGDGAAGGVATYSYSWQLLQVPYGVLGVSLLTALMPRISRAAAAGRTEAVVDDLSLGARMSAVLLLPISALLTVVGGQVAVILFSYGSSDLTQAERLGHALAASAFVLLPYALVLLQLRVFYALDDARTPVAIMAIMVAAKVGFSYLAAAALAPETVVVGLAAANAASFVVGALVGQLWLWHRLGRLRTMRVLSTVTRTGVASVVLALAADAAAALLGRTPLAELAAPVSSGIELLVAGAIGALVLLGGLKLLRVPELPVVLLRARQMLRW